MMKHNPLLVLVDGSSYLYRAFHAMPALSTSRGTPTGAVYGVGNMLRTILADAPDYLAVVFDAKGKTFREERYPQYKANRPPMPEALQRQIQPLHELITALGVPILEVPGVEADDVIGTLAAQARAAGLSVVISSGDKDFAQLVTEDVILLDTMNATRLDPAGVEDKFGIPPARMVDYLALVGDTSDNVPGVPKVGPKTALNWLRTHGSLDAIIANADAVKGKVGENLRANLAQLHLSRELVTIECHVPLDRGPRDLTRKAPDTERLRTLYQQLEFKSWLSELPDTVEEGGSPSNSPSAHAGEPGVVAPRTIPYELILDRKGFETWLERLRAADRFAFDTETTGLDFLGAELVGVSFAVTDNGSGQPAPIRAAYLPVGHDYPDAPGQLPRDTVLSELRPLLEDPNRIKVGQNLKYDRQILARYGIRMAGIAFDTMLESYVLDSVAARHDMDTLALKYLGRKTTTFEAIAGKKTTPKGAKQLTFNQIPLETAAPYAAEDAEVTLALHQELWPRICEVPSIEALFREIEMPLVPILADMERHGVRIDSALLAEQSRELAREIAELEREAHEIAGEAFNLASPKQIQAILFQRQGLPVRAKTPKGQPSTAEAVLQELALDYPLPKLILAHRSLGKLKSTYTDALPARIHPLTGRIHTSYHQAVTATGRLSSSDPNLQNIPIRTPQGRRIRQAFIAPPGFRLLAADYSQIELRIMAHLSGDQGLKRAFSQGRDVHAATAAEVFGGSVEEVTKEQRRRAKAINFGLLYGMSAFGLARQLGIGRTEAQQYIDRYFQRYPGVKDFTESTYATARERGFVQTLFGRRLSLPDINASNTQRRQYAERTAVNAPMQGTAADIIKRAMIRVHRWLGAEKPTARMIMQVHDELVFEVAEEELDRVSAKIAEHMTGAAELSVPLEVEIGSGANWDEAH
uniref:DNA polymerase I n=1 Tax=Candidatus Kentrum sp. FM TaxID=2126340 RepID=A0A450SGP9_9GAMM|nr:MAG: DNA polymerase-1 [Candidatus Kentron sp. FM]VFJ55742.1 MAG: DNA polymerase-1 [Candidatus Kentron sp. FM]VFK10802.1 MAG: DNA polymerase-1 [Candidatus Kentron sp. FM]